MKGTIIITKTKKGGHAVSARELHGFLQAGRDFPNWMEGRIGQYGFTEDIHYAIVRGTEYVLALSAAKEIVRGDVSERGRMAHKIFSDYEANLAREAMTVFSYGDSKVTFKTEDGTVYVNATQMARPFKKKPAKYLELTSTKELMEACVRKKDTSEDQLVMTKMGSAENGGGTWLHEDIAIDFAQWLSIDFRLWCNARLRELLKNSAAPSLGKENEKLQKKLKKQEAQLSFLDRVLVADKKVDIGQAAKILSLPFGRNTLFRKLRERGVLFDNRNEPRQQYVDRGYFEMGEKIINHKDGDSVLVTKITVTQRGLGYLSTLFGKQEN